MTAAPQLNEDTATDATPAPAPQTAGEKKSFFPTYLCGREVSIRDRQDRTKVITTFQCRHDNLTREETTDGKTRTVPTAGCARHVSQDVLTDELVGKLLKDAAEKVATHQGAMRLFDAPDTDFSEATDLLSTGQNSYDAGVLRDAAVKAQDAMEKATEIRVRIIAEKNRALFDKFGHLPGENLRKNGTKITIPQFEIAGNMATVNKIIGYKHPDWNRALRPACEVYLALKPIADRANERRRERNERERAQTLGNDQFGTGTQRVLESMEVPGNTGTTPVAEVRRMKEEGDAHAARLHSKNQQGRKRDKDKRSKRGTQDQNEE